MQMTTATMTKIHAFEAAGLGLAPFRFIGIETAAERGAVQSERAGAGMTFTTNNATCCDYCGQGIMNAYRIQSADRKQFKVGCDCIRKTGDSGLIRHVTEEESAKRRKATSLRRQEKCRREAELISAFRAGRCESLRSLPHPKGRENCTAWDYVAWCVDNKCYGQAVLSMIEKSLD